MKDNEITAVENAVTTVNEFLERHGKKGKRRQRGYSINTTVATSFAATCKRLNLVQSSVVEDLMRQFVHEMKSKNSASGAG